MGCSYGTSDSASSTLARISNYRDQRTPLDHPARSTPQADNMRTSLLRRSCPYVCNSCQQSIRSRRRGYATAAASAPEIYDVVCVGGGPVGLSLLAALSRY